MVAAGLVDTRYKREVASMRQLALAAETTTSTISAMMAGTRDTDGAIVGRVASALGLDAPTVFGWVNRARTEGEPFRPHRDADLLTSEEQEAVNELIRLLALPKKQGGQADGTAAATKVPDSGPDTSPPSNVTELSVSRSTVRGHEERKRVANRPKRPKKPGTGDTSRED